METRDWISYWDRPVTDESVDFIRPDILYIDKPNRTANIVDVPCPPTSDLIKTEEIRSID